MPPSCFRDGTETYSAPRRDRFYRPYSLLEHLGRGWFLSSRTTTVLPTLPRSAQNSPAVFARERRAERVRLEGKADFFCFCRRSSTPVIHFSPFPLLYTSIKRLPASRSIFPDIRLVALPPLHRRRRFSHADQIFPIFIRAGPADINPGIYSSLSHFPARSAGSGL